MWWSTVGAEMWWCWIMGEKEGKNPGKVLKKRECPPARNLNPRPSNYASTEAFATRNTDFSRQPSIAHISFRKHTLLHSHFWAQPVRRRSQHRLPLCWCANGLCTRGTSRDCVLSMALPGRGLLSKRKTSNPNLLSHRCKYLRTKLWVDAVDKKRRKMEST